MNWWLGIILVIASYVLGSVAFGYVVARAVAGIDIRNYGSGNVGATNTWRTLGWKAGLIAFAGDFAKGAVAAWLGKLWGGPAWGVVLGIAAVLGHTYPVFLQFKGGKAVATGGGVLFALNPAITLLALGIWGAILYISGYVSLASLIAAACTPFLLLMFEPSWAVRIFGIIGASIVIWRHRSNIQRLRTGTENRIGRSGKRRD